MNFLNSIIVITLLYAILYMCAWKNRLVNPLQDGYDECSATYISTSWIFCVCYHLFIGIITIGNAGFAVYFIPCLIIFIIMSLCLCNDIYNNTNN